MKSAWLILILCFLAMTPTLAHGQSHSFPHFHIRPKTVQDSGSKTDKANGHSIKEKAESKVTSEQDSTFVDQTANVLLKVVPDIRVLGMLPFKTEQDMRQKARKRDAIVRVLLNSKSQCLEQNHRYINAVVKDLQDNNNILCSPSDEKNLYGRTIKHGSEHNCANIINYINFIIQKL